MIPDFLEGLKQGSNVVEELNAAVSAPATLLFARHVEALLRQFANHDRSSWDRDEDAYWTVFKCNPDAHGRLVSVFAGWMMRQNDAIEKIWIAVGGEGLLWNSDLCRPAKQEEADQLLSRLRTLIARAAQNANQGILYPFDIVTRMDASQPVLPPWPIRLENSLLVTLPREAEADKLGWGHNPGLAVLTKVLAADGKDAEQAAGKHVFEILLFWTVISGSYCHPTKLLFSSPSSDQDAEERMAAMSMARADVEKFHPYSRVHSKTALELAEPLYVHLQRLSVEMKPRALSSMAAYRSALGVQRGVRPFVPTLAVVAYVAALESLVAPSPKCDGNLSCSNCGDLALKHDVTSRMTNILQAVLPTVADKARPGVETMLKHAYRELRSAYVHSAQTEWREFAGAHLWQDITDADEFWRRERPFQTLSRLDDIVRNFIISRIEHGS
jgi:hypothetical protein